MKAILLIGGLGTRLRPLTLQTPKPLLPVLNKPFITYQIDFLKQAGIKEIILCTAYRPEVFHQTLGNGRALGVRLHYVHETQPLGTGGAIKNAERYVSGPTVICNGDILMDLNLKQLIRFHQLRKALISIALTRVQDPTAYGLIETGRHGRIMRFVEKPAPDQVTCDTINAGAYIFEPEGIAAIPKHAVYSVERELFPSLLKEGKPLYAKIFPGYWLDMGTVAKYRQVQADMLQGRILPRRWRPRLKKGPRWVLIGEHSVIEPGVRLIGPTVIGARCRIGRGAVLSNSILFDDVTVGSGASLDEAILGKHTEIPAQSKLESGSVILSEDKN